MSEKSFSITSHTTYDIPGSYSALANNSRGLCNQLIPEVQRKIGSVPHQHNKPFTLCDYGCADGGITLNLFREIINEVKKLHGAMTNICVIYEDQITNDFKSLFYTLFGLIPGSLPLPKEGIFLFATAVSFHEQCCLPESVHFGINIFAVHWLSRRPCRLTDALEVYQSKNVEELRCFAQQAAEDWNAFLEYRAQELVPGGLLVVISLARDDDSFVIHSPSDRGLKATHFFDSFYAVWKDMLMDGIITKEEFQETCITDYHRTREELVAPFHDKTSAMFRLGLRLESCEIIYLRENYEDWANQNGFDDPTAKSSAKTYAEQYVKRVRLWLEASFTGGLNTERSPDDKKKITNELFRRFEVLVAENPRYFRKNYSLAVLHICKVKK